MLSLLSIPGGLVEFLQLIVPDLFALDVWVYYSYNFVVNFDNVCYSYVVTESSFFVYCYNSNFYTVIYRVIYFDNCYILICCWSNRVIDYFDI